MAWLLIRALIHDRYSRVVLGDDHTSHVEGGRRWRAERRENGWPRPIPCWREWCERIVALFHHLHCHLIFREGLHFYSHHND